ncbi:hypothetical protein ACFVYJ_01525 [Pontibacter sp. JAM-7]|uniref:hypothetical protein n=1 Tax=Pontibacter sp. JAM-7 TaxID=3366581 RepID=UPI003AF9553B
MKEYKNLTDWKGSPTGAETFWYRKDETQPLPESLAAVALKEKWVSEVKPAAKAKAEDK